VGDAWIDEPGVCRLEGIARLKERVRDDRGPLGSKPQVLMTGTPEGFNHYQRTFDSDRLPGWNRETLQDHFIEHSIEDETVRYRRVGSSRVDQQACKL